MASILLNEPIPAPGSGMTQDELKALWAELGENHYNHRIGDYANEIPPGPPRPGFDACDRFVPRFHQMLETHIRGDRQALLGNLRAFPPRGTNNEVWNHGIGKYIATYHAIPGKGRAPSGSRSSSTPTPARASTVRTTSPGSSSTSTPWSTVSTAGSTRPTPTPPTGSRSAARRMFAPLNILQVVGTTWAGPQPDGHRGQRPVARHGQRRRRQPVRRCAPPTFRPVGSYEAGRAPMFARGTVTTPTGSNMLPPAVVPFATLRTLTAGPTLPLGIGPPVACPVPAGRWAAPRSSDGLPRLPRPPRLGIRVRAPGLRPDVNRAFEIRAECTRYLGCVPGLGKSSAASGSGSPLPVSDSVNSVMAVQVCRGRGR